MKRIFWALMAVAAIALNACTIENGTGIAEWGYASSTNPQGLDVEGIRIGQYLAVIDSINKQFDRSAEWELVSTTYNGTGMAMSLYAMTASACQNNVKARFESGIAAFRKAYSDQGYQEITDDPDYDMNLRLLYRIASRDHYEVYDITIHAFEVNPKK